MTSPAERIGRRAAIATFALAMVGIVAPLLVLAGGLVFLLATGADRNPATPGVDQKAIAEWKGLLPFAVPWGYFLLMAVAWLAVLVTVWAPDRAYLARWGRRAVLFASPLSTGILALITAMVAFISGLYFEPVDSPLGVGFFLVPIFACLVVSAVSFGRERVVSRRRRSWKRKAAR